MLIEKQYTPEEIREKMQVIKRSDEGTEYFLKMRREAFVLPCTHRFQEYHLFGRMCICRSLLQIGDMVR